MKKTNNHQSHKTQTFGRNPNTSAKENSAKSNGGLFESKNKFTPLETDDDEAVEPVNNSTKKQVFQATDPALAVTLQEIMKKLEGMIDYVASITSFPNQ